MARASKAPTVAQLQQIAAACGIAKSGTKSVVASRIVSALAAHKPVPPGERLLSIDMGLRNFAFCHFALGGSPTGAAAAATALRRRGKSRASTEKPTASSDTSPTPSPRLMASIEEEKPSGPALTLHSWEVLDLTAVGADADVLDYGSKAGLSAVAVDVAVNPLLASGHFFDSARIPPRMLKKMKIDLLGGWICGDGNGNGDGATGASVTMGSREAERTAEIFLRKWRPAKGAGKRKRTKKSLDDDHDDDDTKKASVQARKLDDLTDCVIQGAAWSSWQDMRTKLAQDGTKEILEQLI
ncbi:hypothetical protein MAPG_00733 [Magnaporthiopsis poae ATCC 64411]|uniref:Mitochondrial resolvase Ydc2 catalytic domain-containing protein n=1 Tax=Magnaporthiopsis poae (strain ATCC 64411 / 73-15) TaxID=644358 RepID=A0A0C4DLT7_MAGP6|nr:hypothetical protein MAPG_00733 [Magnaporthiopsis poae ATCC 64411]